MKRKFWLAVSLLLAVVMTGCAHPISLSSDLGSVVGSGGTKSDRRVGLSIAEDNRKREVITPGGGGDKVSYFPYRDLEAGLYVALSQSFSHVTKVNGPADPKVKSEDLHYIVTPEIVTTSWSPSLLTWPPTVFTVELSCDLVDVEGRPVSKVRVFGEGRAEFDEFKSDFSLSAKRASEDALKKLVKALDDSASKLR